MCYLRSIYECEHGSYHVRTECRNPKFRGIQSWFYACIGARKKCDQVVGQFFNRELCVTCSELRKEREADHTRRHRKERRDKTDRKDRSKLQKRGPTNQELTGFWAYAPESGRQGTSVPPSRDIADARNPYEVMVCESPVDAEPPPLRRSGAVSRPRNRSENPPREGRDRNREVPRASRSTRPSVADTDSNRVPNLKPLPLPSRPKEARLPGGSVWGMYGTKSGQAHDFHVAPDRVAEYNQIQQTIRARQHAEDMERDRERRRKEQRRAERRERRRREAQEDAAAEAEIKARLDAERRAVETGSRPSRPEVQNVRRHAVQVRGRAERRGVPRQESQDSIRSVQAVIETASRASSVRSRTLETVNERTPTFQTVNRRGAVRGEKHRKHRGHSRDRRGGGDVGVAIMPSSSGSASISDRHARGLQTLQEMPSIEKARRQRRFSR